MEPEQNINFSNPHENMQVLDNVLAEIFGSEMFGALSSNMKKAGEFLENVKMRPPHLSIKRNKDDSEVEGESEVEDSDVEDCDAEDCDAEDCDAEDETEEDESEVHSDVDGAEAESEDIDHIFLVNVDGDTVGYSTTLRDAMGCLNAECDEFLTNYKGSLFRVQRTTTSVQVFRRTPYLWFLFSEHPVFHGEIQVVTKV